VDAKAPRVDARVARVASVAPPATASAVNEEGNQERTDMGYSIGSVMSIVVTLFARIVGLDRDRAFYPTVMIVVAHYYDLFATMGGSTHALMVETVFMLLFVTAAVVGFKYNLWIVVGALLGHGVFDFFHAGIVTNGGVPEFWPAFCMTYDIGAGTWLSWLLVKSKIAVRPKAQ
jgi:hypothetical protein